MESENKIECQAGLRATGSKDCPSTYLWIRSPRTGNVVEIERRWWHELPKRLIGRVAQKRSHGIGRIEFTCDELRTVAATVKKVQRFLTPARGYVAPYRGMSGL